MKGTSLGQAETVQKLLPSPRKGGDFTELWGVLFWKGSGERERWSEKERKGMRSTTGIAQGTQSPGGRKAGPKHPTTDSAQPLPSTSCPTTDYPGTLHQLSLLSAPSPLFPGEPICAVPSHSVHLEPLNPLVSP